MSTYSLSHLSDHVLLRDLSTLVSQDRATTARLLAHLAEVDARRLYLPASYPSMYAYCIEELRLSEDAARRRIHAARTARRVPAVFAALAAGRLHLSAVVQLAPQLTPENAEELLAAATHKTKFEIEQLIVERFPRLDVPALVQPIAGAGSSTGERVPERVEQMAPGPVAPPAPPSKVAPIAPQRFALHLTISQSTHDKLRYAQALLGHQVPNGDLAQVLDRLLDVAIGQLEKQKFAETKRPGRHQRRSAAGGRYVPAHVRRAVWKRDGGQCTFIGTAGRRCSAREPLEFDHVDPVARGGEATVNGIRLRCRAHNQYGAECVFGAEFMRHKRQEARTAAAARAAANARTAAAKEKAQEVVPWLQRLGISAREARRAAVLCETIPDAPIEQRVRVALSCFGPRTPSRGRVAPAAAGGP